MKSKDIDENITAQEFIELANKEGIPLDGLVEDWFGPIKKMTLTQWIDYTIRTYEDLNEDLKNDRDAVNTNEKTIITPCYEWLYKLLLVRRMGYETKRY